MRAHYPRQPSALGAAQSPAQTQPGHPHPPSLPGVTLHSGTTLSPSSSTNQKQPQYLIRVVRTVLLKTSEGGCGYWFSNLLERKKNTEGCRWIYSHSLQRGPSRPLTQGSASPVIKQSRPRGGVRDGGGGDGREGEWELTAPLPEGLPPPNRTSQGQTQVRGPGAGSTTLPGRRSQQRRCPQGPPCPSPPPQPALGRPSSRSLIARCGNRTLEQVVTPAPRPAPRAALETSATPVTKPRHPPRPCEEHGEPGPFRLPSATPYLQPRTHPPPRPPRPHSPLCECPSHFF